MGALKQHYRKTTDAKKKRRTYSPFPFEKPFPSPGWTDEKSACHSQTAGRDDTWVKGGEA